MNKPLPTSRAALGRATYAHNLGLSEHDAETLMAHRAGTLFTSEAYNAAGGPAWQSTELTARDRSIAVIAALVGQHVTDDRLTPYLNLARHSGVTEEGLET